MSSAKDFKEMRNVLHNANLSVQDLEEMRNVLHDAYGRVIPNLTSDLLTYADELDKAYRDIKISKIAGSSGCIVGGVLSAVGFGLSFVTFGASLGLVIAGGIIGGMGGITTGGAVIGDVVSAKQAREKTEKQLTACNEVFRKMLEKCKDISDKLEVYGNIEEKFPSWFKLWRKLIFGTGKVATSFGWQVVANTVITAIQIGKGLDVAWDVTTTAVIPAFRSLTNAASKGFHVAGGVFGMLFIPVDIYSLVSNSIELHKNEEHVVSKKIREIVKEIQDKCPTATEINNTIDSCIAGPKAEVLVIYRRCP